MIPDPNSKEEEEEEEELDDPSTPTVTASAAVAEAECDDDMASKNCVNRSWYLFASIEALCKDCCAANSNFKSLLGRFREVDKRDCAAD